MFRTRHLVVFALCAAAGASFLLPESRAVAQGVALEEIVVTARKREEALVDIPFAVSAFSEEELNAANLKNFVDMQLFTPGLTYQQATANRADRGVPNIVIRGLNINAFSSSSVAAMFFIDGAPVLGGEVGSFVDVTRVEVLRGPQTAYFGRNTFSGAVNLVTSDPGEAFGGSVGLDLDRFGTADLQLSVEGPIIADRLSFRLTGRSNKKGGHYKNNRNGAREIGDEDTRSLVATILATPTDALRFKLRLEDIEIDDGPQPSMRFPSSFANCDPDGNGSMTYRCGAAARCERRRVPGGPQRRVRARLPGQGRLRAGRGRGLLSVFRFLAKADRRRGRVHRKDGAGQAHFGRDILGCGGTCPAA